MNISVALVIIGGGLLPNIWLFGSNREFHPHPFSLGTRTPSLFWLVFIKFSTTSSPSRLESVLVQHLICVSTTDGRTDGPFTTPPMNPIIMVITLSSSSSSTSLSSLNSVFPLHPMEMNRDVGGEEIVYSEYMGNRSLGRSPRNICEC